MTIPRLNWCTTCHEACHHHPTVCSVCGTPLGPAPSRSTQASDSVRSNAGGNGRTEQSTGRGNAAARPDTVALLIERARNAQRLIMSAQSQQRVEALTQEVLARLGVLTGNMQEVPQQRSGHRPTSKTTLSRLPRIVLDENSHLFHQATVQLHVAPSSSLRSSSSGNDSVVFEGIRGEFGAAKTRINDGDGDDGGGGGGRDSTGQREGVNAPTEEMHLENFQLYLASPSLTGKHPLDTDVDFSGADAVLYMERGDGITFARKACMAQDAGAKALVIGNNMRSPWPYVMKDSKKEAAGVTIPVVMIQQKDAQALKRICQQGHGLSDVGEGGAAMAAANARGAFRISLKLQRSSRECVVCQDELQCSQTLLQISGCGHLFHEQCALAWLQNHNTCPYCRLELPTDDAEYEHEHRRFQRTHAGSQLHDPEAEVSAILYG